MLGLVSRGAARPQHSLRPGLSQLHRGLPATPRGCILAQHGGLLWPGPGSAIQLPCVPGLPSSLLLSILLPLCAMPFPGPGERDSSSESLTLLF